jgi:hypothetical protein
MGMTPAACQRKNWPPDPIAITAAVPTRDSRSGRFRFRFRFCADVRQPIGSAQSPRSDEAFPVVVGRDGRIAGQAFLRRGGSKAAAEYRALRETVGGFLDLCLTPELAAEVTLQPLRRFAHILQH